MQVKGHQRIPSGAQEFKENTKRDALQQLQDELEKLLETAPLEKQPALRKQYDGFAKLFERFLQEEGPSVDWNKIEKLPPGAVRVYLLLKIFHIFSFRSLVSVSFHSKLICCINSPRYYLFSQRFLFFLP